MSLQVKHLVVGPIETNCYLVWDRLSGEAAVIDPGGQPETITRAIDKAEIKPTWVLFTHGHFDHTFCVGNIASQYGCRIGGNRQDEPQITESLDMARLYHDMSGYVPFAVSDWLSHGDRLTIGGVGLGIMHTPGHSPGGLTLAAPGQLFCGDALFAGSIGRTDLPGGSLEQLLGSIRSHIFAFADDTVVYPGHGKATTVGREKRSNPYCRIA